MAEQFQKEQVLDELARSTDVGETRSRAQLQAACAIGAGDLDEVLRELHQGGLVSQVAPDEWEAAGVGELAATLHDEDAAPPVRAAPRADSRPVGLPPAAGHRSTVTTAQVSMPRAVADVLDAAALGALLKAGIETTNAREVFVFEVTP